MIWIRNLILLMLMLTPFLNITLNNQVIIDSEIMTEFYDRVMVTEDGVTIRYHKDVEIIDYAKYDVIYDWNYYVLTHKSFYYEY